MILTLTSGKSPVYIREVDVVKPHPSGGSTVWAANDRFMVVEGFDTIMAMMAQPTPSQPTPSQPEQSSAPAPRPAAPTPSPLAGALQAGIGAFSLGKLFG